MRTRSFGLFCCGMAVMMARAAIAATVMVHPYITGSASRLWVADTVGGTAVPAPAAFGVDFISDLAQSCDGDIYATDFTRLYRVDAIGVAVPVHPSNVHGFNCVGLDFTADGTLFGITQSGQVLKFDTSAATAQVVFQSAFGYLGDIAFAGMEGTNYIFYASATSDKIIRLTVDVSSTAGDAETAAPNIIAAGEHFAAMDFVGGILTGVANSGKIYNIDVVTGIGTLIGELTGPANYGGMASATQPTVTLSVARIGSQIEVSWQPPFTNYVLEATGVLPAVVWSEVPTFPLVSSGKATVVLNAPEAAMFFRLRCR